MIMYYDHGMVLLLLLMMMMRMGMRRMRRL